MGSVETFKTANDNLIEKPVTNYLDSRYPLSLYEDCSSGKMEQNK